MGTRKFDQIDGLRFFAVFAVLCAHWSSSASHFFNQITFQARGIDLFFVISGFLITLGLIRAKEKTETKGTALYKFYIRRFLRIFPIYYLTLFILWYIDYNHISASIWWDLSYLSNFHIIRTHDWGAAGHFWSLSVEEQFYLIWPFIILFVPNRRLPAVMIASVLLSLAAKTYWFMTTTFVPSTTFWTAYIHPLGALDTLSLGALLAYLYNFHTDILKKILFNPFVIVIVTVQMMFCIYLYHTRHYNSIYLIGIRTSFGLFAIWLIGRATFGFTGVMGYILGSRPLMYIGKISYAVYLFHPFVPALLSRDKYPENENLRFVLYAIVTLGLASGSWYLFESRILKLKERFE